MEVKCTKCGRKREGLEPRCKYCGAPFDIDIDFPYRENNFPYIDKWISLGEIKTPILKKGNVFFKLDYFSPTFSYKDRGAKTLISFLFSKKDDYRIEEINEDSSGNAGAAIAAYGTNAGFKVNIFVPEKTMPGKIRQIEAYGANIFKVKGSREDVQNAAENHSGIYASHVFMPEFRDGIRTLSYEIFEDLGKIDRIFVPVSAGTLLIGMFKGFKHLFDSGEIDKIPEIVAVQTEQVSPLCARINGYEYNPDREINSLADALVSTKPPLIDLMEKIVRDYGRCITVSENEIKEARYSLARIGIYAEYSSSTVLAAFKKKNFEGKNVLVITGNGLKNSN